MTFDRKAFVQEQKVAMTIFKEERDQQNTELQLTKQYLDDLLLITETPHGLGPLVYYDRRVQSFVSVHGSYSVHIDEDISEFLKNESDYFERSKNLSFTLYILRTGWGEFESDIWKGRPQNTVIPTQNREHCFQIQMEAFSKDIEYIDRWKIYYNIFSKKGPL